VPFEPLETDEKLDTAVKRTDVDAHLIRGCIVFAVVSLIAYALIVAPFFLVPNLHLSSSLLRACLIGGVPSLILGVLSGRLGGVPGASAFVAGSLMGSVFLYLKLNQMPVLAKLGEVPELGYPASVAYLIPLSWIVVSFVTAFAATPKGDYSTAMTMRPESEDKPAK